MGFSAKHFFDPNIAMDLGLGVAQEDFDVHSDLLVHFTDLLPQPKKGKLPLFLGLGVKIQDEKKTLFGFRFVGGLAYWFPNHPLELFAEIAPVLRVAPSTGSELDGGVGLRYYFSLGGK